MFSLCSRVAAESTNKENEEPDYDNLHSDESSSDEEVLYSDRFGKSLLMSTHPNSCDRFGKSLLTVSYSSIWNQNVPPEIPFFIRNQYSAIARKRSNTTAIIVRVKI